MGIVWCDMVVCALPSHWGLSLWLLFALRVWASARRGKHQTPPSREHANEPLHALEKLDSKQFGFLDFLTQPLCSRARLFPARRGAALDQGRNRLTAADGRKGRE